MLALILIHGLLLDLSNALDLFDWVSQVPMLAVILKSWITRLI